MINHRSRYSGGGRFILLLLLSACSGASMPFSCRGEDAATAPPPPPRPPLPREIAPYMDALEALAADALARCEQLYIPNVGCPYYMPPAALYDITGTAGVQRISDHPPGEGHGLVTVEAACTYPIDDMLAKHPELADTVRNYPIRMQSAACSYRPWGRIPSHRFCNYGIGEASWNPDERTEISVYRPNEGRCVGQWLEVWIESTRADGVGIRFVATFDRDEGGVLDVLDEAR